MSRLARSEPTSCAVPSLLLLLLLGRAGGVSCAAAAAAAAGAAGLGTADGCCSCSRRPGVGMAQPPGRPPCGLAPAPRPAARLATGCCRNSSDGRALRGEPGLASAPWASTGCRISSGLLLLRRGDGPRASGCACACCPCCPCCSCCWPLEGTQMLKRLRTCSVAGVRPPGAPSPNVTRSVCEGQGARAPHRQAPAAAPGPWARCSAVKRSATQRTGELGSVCQHRPPPLHRPHLLGRRRRGQRVHEAARHVGRGGGGGAGGAAGRGAAHASGQRLHPRGLLRRKLRGGI
jgi:hypothetical protein